MLHGPYSMLPITVSGPSATLHRSTWAFFYPSCTAQWGTLATPYMACRSFQLQAPWALWAMPWCPTPPRQGQTAEAVERRGSPETPPAAGEQWGPGREKDTGSHGLPLQEPDATCRPSTGQPWYATSAIWCSQSDYQEFSPGLQRSSSQSGYIRRQV